MTSLAYICFILTLLIMFTRLCISFQLKLVKIPENVLLPNLVPRSLFIKSPFSGVKQSH